MNFDTDSLYITFLFDFDRNGHVSVVLTEKDYRKFSREVKSNG